MNLRILLYVQREHTSAHEQGILASQRVEPGRVSDDLACGMPQKETTIRKAVSFENTSPIWSAFSSLTCLPASGTSSENTLLRSGK